MKIICVIPARYQSSRFPGKPLADICGKPMIWWAYNTVSRMPEISEAYVATDDKRVSDVVQSFGGKAIMTGECACGTDRVAEACKGLSFDVVLNIQGDEPMVHCEQVKRLISAFDDPSVYMATLRKKFDNEKEIKDPNIVKLVVNNSGNAIYFSRSVIPYIRDHQNSNQYAFYRHIGMYGYTRDFLYDFVSLPQGVLEKAESLEQLRAIENGYNITTVETTFQSIGVDLPEHISIVEKEIQKSNRGSDFYEV